MRLNTVAITAVLVAGCAAAPASDRISFSAFDGAWQGVGTFQGLPSQVEARFAPVAGRSAWVLDISIVATPQTGEPIRFAGHAEYELVDGAPAGGKWTDSQGSAYPIMPRFEAGALIVNWGGGAYVGGRSEYRIQNDGDLQIDDFAPSRGGDLRRFATAELHRR